MPGGRPQITLDDLPLGWREKMLEMARDGASEVEIRVEALDCMPEGTWYALKEREPEFLQTQSHCKMLCEAWWLKKGRLGISDPDFNHSPWYSNMKNRFGWKDKKETDVTLKSIRTDDDDEMLARLGVKVSGNPNTPAS